MRRRRARFDPSRWAALRERVWQEQGGRCADCGRAVGLGMAELAHLKPLGMGRSRHDHTNPINGRDNVAVLDRACHVALDSLPLDQRVERAARIALESSRWSGSDERDSWFPR